MTQLIKVSIIDHVGGHADNYYNYGLAGNLAKNGAEVYYFTSNATREIKRDNVSTFFTFKNIWKQRNKFLKLFIYLQGLRESLNYSKQHKINIIHLMIFQVDWLFFLTIILCKTRKFKVIITLHDVKSFIGNDVPEFVQSWLFRIIDRVIVHNKYSFDEVILNYPKTSCFVIEHGGYTQFINRVTNRGNFAPFKLLFFGQIKKVKGLDILLEAIGLLKNKGLNINLTIAGKVWKDDFSVYQRIIDDNNLSEFINLDIKYIPDNDVWNYFNNSDLVILPYRKIYQSGVLLMAMSYGRLVLTSDIEAFSQVIIDGENGFLFETENVKSLAEKIEFLYYNIDKFQIMESKAYEFVKEMYDWEKSATKTFRLYQAMLSES